MQPDISKLLQIDHDCKSCENDRSLYYIIVNQSREIVDYEQAALLSYELSSKPKVAALSDMVSVDSATLYVSFVEDLARHLEKNFPDAQKPYRVDIVQDLNESLKEELKEYSPPNILWVPLKIAKNNVVLEYHLLLFKIQPWSDAELEVIEHLASSYQFYLFAMRKCSFSSKLASIKFKSKYMWGVAAIVMAAMFYPIRMNLVAPFEVEANKPYVITSPIDGIVDEILVESNQYVSKNTLIVKLEDVDFKNNYDIARQKLETARAELYSTKQASFFEREKMSQIPTLQKDITLKQSEMQFYKSQLDKTRIHAHKDGVAIIDNPISFKGKPVSTGEKIMLIADPNDIQIKIMVPVSDALFIQENADVTFTFDNKVFEAWKGRVKNISYTPQLTPENVLSYKVIAEMDDKNHTMKAPQIGVRGTARIYSQEVSLFYYLFRKPLTHLRQLGIW